MALSLGSLQTQDIKRPPRMIVYGGHGVGKNTFASGAPNPILLAVETGGQPAGLGVPQLEIESFEDMTDAIGMIGNPVLDIPEDASDEDRANLNASFEALSSRSSVILDSLDHFEQLVWAEAVKRNNESDDGSSEWKHWNDIESPGYGKGYAKALEVWIELIDALDWLWKQGKAIILIAHSQTKTYKSPDVEPYDRHGIKLKDRASERLQESVDIVAFATQKVAIEETKGDFGAKNKRAVSSGRRIMYLQERATHIAKNRMNLPLEMDFSWPMLAEALADAKPWQS